MGRGALFANPQASIDDQGVARDAGGGVRAKEMGGPGDFLERGEPAGRRPAGGFRQAFFTFGQDLPGIGQDGTG